MDRWGGREEEWQNVWMTGQRGGGVVVLQAPEQAPVSVGHVSSVVFSWLVDGGPHPLPVQRTPPGSAAAVPGNASGERNRVLAVGCACGDRIRSAHSWRSEMKLLGKNRFFIYSSAQVLSMHLQGCD